MHEQNTCDQNDYCVEGEKKLIILVREKLGTDFAPTHVANANKFLIRSRPPLIFRAVPVSYQSKRFTGRSNRYSRNVSGLVLFQLMLHSSIVFFSSSHYGVRIIFYGCSQMVISISMPLKPSIQKHALL